MSVGLVLLEKLRTRMPQSDAMSSDLIKRGLKPV